MRNSEVPVFSARNCSASRTMRGLSRSDQPASAPCGAGPLDGDDRGDELGIGPGEPARRAEAELGGGFEDQVVPGAGRLHRDRRRLQVRGVPARPLVCGDQVGEQVAVERVVDGVRLQRRVAGEREAPGEAGQPLPLPALHVGGHGGVGPVGAGGHLLGTPVDEQHRGHPFPPLSKQLVDQRGGLGPGGGVAARGQVGHDRRGADALVRDPHASRLGRVVGGHRPSTSTGRPCSSLPRLGAAVQRDELPRVVEHRRSGGAGLGVGQVGEVAGVVHADEEVVAHRDLPGAAAGVLDDVHRVPAEDLAGGADHGDRAERPCPAACP